MIVVLRQCRSAVLPLVVLFACLPLTANSESPQIADPVSALERKVQKLVDNSSLVFTGTHVETKFFRKEVTQPVEIGHQPSTRTGLDLFTANVFTIEEVHKGTLDSPVIEVIQWGGMDGRERTWGPNYYYLQLNAKFVVFVNFDSELSGGWRAVQGNNGVFKLLQDKGELYLQNTVAGEVIFAREYMQYKDGDIVLEDENPKISFKRVKQMLRSEGAGR